MEGWDHKVSATPQEMKIITQESKIIFKALGSCRLTSPEDYERKNEFRRSIVTSRACKKGEVLSVADLDAKRPGTGIPPGDLSYVLGRTLKEDLSADQLLTLDDLI